MDHTITRWEALNLGINLWLDRVLQRLVFVYYALRDVLH